MIRTNKRAVMLFAVAALFFVIGGALLVNGCGRKESAREEPSGVIEKNKGHEKAKESPGVVFLKPEAVVAAGIMVQKIAPETFYHIVAATAAIELNADKLSKVSPRIAGKVMRITASQGDRVKAGQALVYLDTVELGQAWSEYLKARGRLELARNNLQREQSLFEKRISPEKDVMKARQDFSEAEADIRLVQERFHLLGLDASQIENRNEANAYGHHPLVPVSSTISGVVIEKSVTQGELVSPDKVLFTVADISTLWVVIDIYEKDLVRVKRGMGAKISVTALPGRYFSGKIAYLADVVDEKTRTVKARVVVDNRIGLLKPGMFATVQLDYKDGAATKAIAVPEEAVFLDGSERCVFVQEEDGKFAVRRISVGLASGEKIEIKEGLKEGEVVVTKGVFTLKSELKKESLRAE